MEKIFQMFQTKPPKMFMPKKFMIRCVRNFREFIVRQKYFCTLIILLVYPSLRFVDRCCTQRLEMNADQWIKSAYFGCDVNFVGYGHRFAVLKYAHIDVKTRTFSIPCAGFRPRYRFNEGPNGNILNLWLNNMTLYEYSYSETMTKTTIALYRTEAHHFFRSMCEWYNIFLVSSLLNVETRQLRILFMDDRPPSLLEDIWYTLFSEISRYKFIQPQNVFKTLIWNIYGYDSPMNNQKLDSLPYLEDFREFVFKSYKLRPFKTLDCKNLNVTLIYRRDFIDHPERTDALVHRKFHNNSELLSIAKAAFRGHKVIGMFLENFSMKEQLITISNTDILIGMHGAGMSHVMFLPPHAGVLELFPDYVYLSDRYRTLARWRGLKYLQWQNDNPDNELLDYRTRIPFKVFYKNLYMLKRQMCG